MPASSSVTQELLRTLPGIDRLLLHSTTKLLLQRFNREYVLQQCREVLDDLRTAIRSGETVDPAALEESSILKQLAHRLEAGAEPALVRVVNATGTVLHTNLGRALLSSDAVDMVRQAATMPVTLEYDLAAGERGQREQTIERLLVALTGAEAATVVNNNAAAVLLAVNTLAEGKDVIVSRGELIEIGGSFRIPEIMVKSGAALREVGTTNRTHADDYARAITERTALLLKVHTSNYRIVGFSAEVPLPALVKLGRARGVPVMEDLGSGALIDLSLYGLPKEPVVAERVSHGADIVTFSGDKLLGGPQAGLIVGRAALVDKVRTNPLHRALRCGKLTIAALEATLRLYRESSSATEGIPTLRTLTRSVRDLEAMGNQVLPALRKALGAGFRASLADSTAQVGSGALPTEGIPTKVIVVEHAHLEASRVAERFRRASPAIIGRVHDGRFLLDLRTVLEAEELIPHWSPAAGDS